MVDLSRNIACVDYGRYTSKTTLEYSGSYFRFTIEVIFLDSDFSWVLTREYSRIDGISKEIAMRTNVFLGEEEGQLLGLPPGLHVMEERIKLLKVQKEGYPHMGTSGFAAFLILSSFCIYTIPLKRRRMSAKIGRDLR